MVTVVTLVLTLPVAALAVFDHGTWDVLLKKYVDADGKVAYRRLQSDDDAAALRAYLDSLASARVDELPPPEQLAFWINAYNAMIVAAVLDGYTAEGTFSRINLFKRYDRVLAGEKRTPDHVEHEIIRPRFQDFRAHFALVCASTSCPKLRREAYVGSRLDLQLEDQARIFVNDALRNRVDTGKETVELSQIFSWFKEDFERDGKTLADRLAPYLSAEQTALVQRRPPTFLPYDWTMNAQTGERPD